MNSKWILIAFIAPHKHVQTYSKTQQKFERKNINQPLWRFSPLLTRSEVPAGRWASPRFPSQAPVHASVLVYRRSASSSPEGHLSPPGGRDAELPYEQLKSHTSTSTTDRAAWWPMDRVRIDITNIVTVRVIYQSWNTREALRGGSCICNSLQLPGLHKNTDLMLYSVLSQ